MDTTLEWMEPCLTGHPEIDREHREFNVLGRALQDADNADLPAAFQAMHRHLQTHFSLEEALMAQHNFPARACHAEEHERVLESMREVAERLRSGDLDVVRELASALMDWFPGHSDHMDASVAHWITRKSTGGAPVVLRRSMRVAHDAVSWPALHADER